MRLLIVSEGGHELSGALPTLVSRQLQFKFAFECKKISDRELRVHPGKGPGYFKKAIRCIRHAQEQGFDGIVVVIDQDDQPARRRQFSDAQDEQALTSIPRSTGCRRQII